MPPAADTALPRAPAMTMAEDSAFLRMWRGFMTARVSIAIALVIFFSVLYGLAPGRGVSTWLIGLCATYLAAALVVRLVTRPPLPGHTFDSQWVSTVGIDLLAFSTLQFLQAAGMNYMPLFALPVLTAGVLGSPLLALGTAAAVTLLLLGDAWVFVLHTSQEYAPPFLQAGLTGIGYFAIALLANQLAGRLAREEAQARLSQQAARTQAQVNELIVEQVADGVLVIGADSAVHTANPAARELLRMDSLDAFTLDAHAAWQPLLEIARRTVALQAPQLAEVALTLDSGERQTVRVRTRIARGAGGGSGGSLCVMFLEDLREMEARLRTEKLAAMGRMSAAVAHEIRNPLAAIAQANALLDEELVAPAQRQLSALVQQNARRLSHIVEEILDIARVQQQAASPLPIELDDAVAQSATEWAQQAQAAGRMEVQASSHARVLFDDEHLRRVLVNLLDNALRYAGPAPDSIRVVTEADDEGAWLRVWSDGLPLEQGVQRHLFEPFFSSESRSSGLGLYICRELCERHGASIGYRRAPAQAGGREGNEFVIRLRTAGASSGTAPFDTMAA
jgi:two-component system sensor histidine kinase PilS (NtrC family)